METALSVLDFPIICRICLAKADVKPLDHTLSELFHKITSIKVDPNGNLPISICSDCIEQLQNISAFIELSKTSDAKLQHVFEKQTKQSSSVQESSDSEGEDKEWVMDIVQGNVEISNDSFAKEENELHIEVKPDLLFRTESDDQEKNIKTYECILCDKEYPNQENLNNHLQSHTDAKTHVCTICGKAFKLISSLIRHNKCVHKMVKPSRCELCSKEFPSFFLRKQHDCKVPQTQTAINLEDNSSSMSSIESRDNKLGEKNECNICGESFKLSRLYQQHVKKHKNTATKLYRCEKCSDSFTRKSLLEIHMYNEHNEDTSLNIDLPKEKTDDKSLTCEFCGKQFPTKKSLCDHLPIHTKQYQCDVCDKVCTKRFHLDNHRKLHTGEKPFQCEFCEKTFRLKSARKAHLRIHTGERPYHCRLCKKTFAQKSNVVDHERRHTGDTPYVCRFCSKWFIQKSHLKRHESTHTGGKVLQRDGDDGTVKTVEKASENRGENIGGLEDLSYNNSGFPRPERKDRHIKMHSTKSTESNAFYSCNQCEEIFTLKTEYRSHITQHGDPPAPTSSTECQICHKVFASKYNMQSHMVIHNENRDFLCNYCGKGFSKKVYLDTHSLIHSGEKPYECKECGKSFRQRSTYNRHVLVHTDKRSFKCDQCDKTFQQKTHLTRHRMVHTGEKKFQCSYCGKKFGQNVNLKAHVRTHTGETAFYCSVCGRGFYDSSSMKKHVKGHARDGNNLTMKNEQGD